MIVDGMDQAKVRLPRIFKNTKLLETLIRPALHVQGAWAHGFGYHLAVMDADMRHDTNNNVEVIGRLLNQVFEAHGSLPLGMHLQQDNTSRECKNQFIVKWAVKLVALGVFRWVSLNHLIKGHTHEDIDATFGQLTVRLAARQFDDDQDVVSILLGFLGDLGIESTSRRASTVYKLDEAAEWTRWWSEIAIELSKLTGPRAPHVFRVCLRSDLGGVADDVTVEPFPGNLDPCGGDVVVVVKEYMHSRSVHHMFTAWPERHRKTLARFPPSTGVHERRPFKSADRKKQSVKQRSCAVRVR